MCVCVCRPAPPVSRQEGHPCSHGGAITLLKKVKKKKRQIVQVMSYLESRFSSTYWMRRLLCAIDYNGGSNWGEICKYKTVLFLNELHPN